MFLKKLLNSIKDIEICQLEYYTLASTFQGLIPDIHASLATTSSVVPDRADKMFFRQKITHKES